MKEDIIGGYEYRTMYHWAYSQLSAVFKWGKTPDFMELGRREEAARMAVEYITLFASMHPCRFSLNMLPGIEQDGMEQFLRYLDEKYR